LYAFPTQLLFADESETNEEQALKQKNAGSRDSTNSNCGENSIDSGSIDIQCGSVDIGDEHTDLQLTNQPNNILSHFFFPFKFNDLHNLHSSILIF
jgi:hypothetical protein